VLPERNHVLHGGSLPWREAGRYVAMQERLKRYALVLCLFVFLFVTLGGGFTTRHRQGRKRPTTREGTSQFLYGELSSQRNQQVHAR
jgi:Tfp pilus assembly protein PilN